MKGKELPKLIEESVEFIQKKTSIMPKMTVVLSGGLNDFVEAMDDRVAISAGEIPHFPTPTAEGHKGLYIFGKLDGVPIVAMKGRCHFYEGYSPVEITYPHHVLNALGSMTLINVNATGGINAKYKPGDIMLIKDHINLMGINPLVGVSNYNPKAQFPDMTNAYDEDLRRIAKGIGKEIGLKLHEGVYIATSGPNYETKAEIAAYRNWGADTVGMSTVPEVLVANYLGMKVIAFCCIANLAADLHPGGMSHQEVLGAMKSLEPKLVLLLIETVKKIGRL
ncbi:MAG: purine-nucleoside phosphorylase [Syntrophaceae bacterium]|nr:purine-nucleoside phosphorylase [bacterium]MCG2740040.1 purine-nucleoside phosphorylase [Syntrophaceae bacterium]